MDKKIKVFVISDMILSPSGVGTQTKYMVDALVKTGRYEFICLGGAVKHHSYEPIKYGDDVVIFPVDGYGNHDMIRSLIRTHKPDMLWFMTDPRFYEWLWEIENEIRPLIPMVYYHVWDNYPYPKFNKPHYESCDVIVNISKVTDDIVKTVAPNVESYYMPHAVDNNIFSKVDDQALATFRKEHSLDDGKFTVFWNNRNARRKQSGTVIWWFNEFLKIVGKDKARLVMHTDIRDPHGQDLGAIIQELGLGNREVVFSTQKHPPEVLALLYNNADCTINIADAEGFGLGTMESLSCETPIIVTMTGGLQEQVTDGENWFGIGLKPASSAIIGSLQVPYIREDRVSEEDVVQALLDMYNKTDEERSAIGKAGREHILRNYNFDDYGNKWVELMDKIHEEHGSWDNRKKHNRWVLKEIR